MCIRDRSYVEEHCGVADGHNQRELPVEHKEQDERARHLDKALYDHCEAVVEGVGDGVDVVCEVAHDIAAVTAVEILQRQGLEVGKEVAADVKERSLRHRDHALGVAQCAEHAEAVDAGGKYDTRNKTAPVPAGEAVDNGAYHVRPDEVGNGAHGDEQCNGKEQRPVMSHIAEQPPDRLPEMFGLFTAERTRHRPHLPSSARHRFPDKSGPPRGAAYACRRRGCGRRRV